MPPAAKKPTPRAAAKKPAPRARKPKTDGLPLLSAGSCHPVVIECAHKLDKAGFGDSPASRGENPYGELGPGEISAFTAFRQSLTEEQAEAAYVVGAERTDTYVTPEIIALALAL